MFITKNIPIIITINDNNHCAISCNYHEWSDYASGEFCILYRTFLSPRMKRCDGCKNDF